MKSIFTVVVAFIVFVSSAFAIETVPPPAQPGNGAVYTYNPATGAQQSAPLTVTSVRKAVARGLKVLTGKNGALTKIDAKASEAAAEAKKAADAVAKQGGKLDAIAGDAKGANDGIHDLNSKLLDKKDGEFAKLGAAVKDSANNSDHNLFVVTVWLTLVILAVGLGTFWFLRRDVKTVDVKVDQLPEKTAEAVRTLKQETFTFNYGGHHYVFTPSITDNLFNTAYVPATGIAPVAGPEDIVRLQTQQRERVITSSQGVFSKHAAWLNAGRPAPANERDRQQVLLVEYLNNSTSELQIS